MCDVHTHAGNIALTCVREGKKHANKINLRQATVLSQGIQSLATVRLHYLNEQKNLAVMNIEYR
ncbi:putative periplasmic protein [Salmonella bongori N268-08]|uniref:Putative periplasmic protein n=1 Tax=Salmonella bongori N268-08 TaxID=1197719 RepID=S5N6V2_SALBN|nr:putative periplasmic protein [Salmonella bongori N268-08]